jgi:hypothetical protein
MFISFEGKMAGPAGKISKQAQSSECVLILQSCLLFPAPYKFTDSMDLQFDLLNTRWLPETNTVMFCTLQQLLSL